MRRSSAAPCLLLLSALAFHFPYSALAQHGPEPEAPRGAAQECSSRSGDGCVCVTRQRATAILAGRAADKAVPEARCPDPPSPFILVAATSLGAALMALLGWAL